ncbi:MAG: TetR/AcrR family transcriptional regulator [Nitrospinota bacterium]
MTKGNDTRSAILKNALDVAGENGLELLTIGKLADALEMSKSGLFAHFKSKENLQLDVLDYAAEIFTQKVLVPAVKKPRGITRIRAIVNNWLEWTNSGLPGGCFFISTSIEYDDRHGKIRDHLLGMQKKWINALAFAAKLAVEEGQFKKKADCGQFAYELFSIMAGYHHFKRMLGDAKAEQRVKKAFEGLISRYKSGK